MDEIDLVACDDVAEPAEAYQLADDPDIDSPF